MSLMSYKWGKITVDRRLEEVENIAIGRASTRESVPRSSGTWEGAAKEMGDGWFVLVYVAGQHIAVKA